MEQISYAHSVKQAKRISRFNANPDSASGLVSLPKKIDVGESVTIPDGRVVVHPNLEIDGTLTIEDDGELFVPFGGTLVSSDLVHPVDTITDLRNETGKYKYVYVTGYHTKNDGAFGSHIFRLKGVKTTETDNGGTVIIATIGGIDYVYELQYEGAVNVKWFGAKGDGVTDDTSAFASAFFYGYKSIICGKEETYKINLLLNSSIKHIRVVFDLNGSTLTSDTGTIFEVQKYADFVIKNGTFDGNLGQADHGIKVGYGVQQSSSGLVLENVKLNNFKVSCLYANKASYTSLYNCLLYTYYGDAISGIWYTFLDTFGRYVGFTNCVNINASSIIHFKSTHFFCETNVTPETLVKITDCDHFEFNECTFEPQNTCTIAQVLITSSTTYSSDIHFSGCYWLGELNNARNSDSLLTVGNVHRVRLIRNNFYIVGSGFYNLHINSTGEPFEIWDCYSTNTYNDSTRANITVLNSTSQQYYNQNIGAFTLGNASVNKGLFVHKSDGTLLNAGQFYYNDQWEFVVGGNGQAVISATGVRPYSDNAKTLGSSSYRWSNIYGTNIRAGAGSVIWTSGVGTPEGVVTAVVGSLYTRTDGGANTTLYIKESGSGNTGWIAK